MRSTTTDATILLRARVNYRSDAPSDADAALLNAALHLEGRLTPDGEQLIHKLLAVLALGDFKSARPLAAEVKRRGLERHAMEIATKQTAENRRRLGETRR